MEPLGGVPHQRDAYKSYDTRYDDRPGWARVAGVTQATAMTCTKVGYTAAATHVTVASDQCCAHRLGKATSSSALMRGAAVA